MSCDENLLKTGKVEVKINNLLSGTPSFFSYHLW